MHVTIILTAIAVTYVITANVAMQVKTVITEIVVIPIITVMQVTTILTAVAHVMQQCKY